MENTENLQTKHKKDINNHVITDSLDTLNLLLKVEIESGETVLNISAKTGINTQSLYRYISGFDSQKKSQPSVSVLTKVAKALGYELRLVRSE